MHRYLQICAAHDEMPDGARTSSSAHVKGPDLTRGIMETLLVVGLVFSSGGAPSHARWAGPGRTPQHRCDHG